MSHQSAVRLTANAAAWDKVAPHFYGAIALPDWGPLAVGSNADLLGSIAGKAIAEIGCGSGHSLKYLIEHGASKVFGIDLSREQIEAARALNHSAITSGQVSLFNCPMEERVSIDPVDIVVSVYALGWTTDPAAVLANIRSYLKPEGLFVWSWEHPLYRLAALKEDTIVVASSYFDESEVFIKGWGGSEGVYQTPRTIARWFDLLTASGFAVEKYLEPAPVAVPTRSGGYYDARKTNALPLTMVFACRRMN
jgi:SAM-dependent methyltransferase